MSEFLNVEGGSGEVRAKVLFFHGLAGNSHSTWQSTKDPDAFWPRWLVEDIPGIRAATANYSANISDWFSTAMPLTDRAENLTANMTFDQDLLSRPIILIGHSLGGIVIKQIIRSIEGRSATDEKYKKLLNNIRLVVFLGTPHSGSKIAVWANRLGSIIRPSSLTRSLVLDEANLRDLNKWYRDFISRTNIKHLTFSETQPTRFIGTVVSQSSSDPGFANSRPIPVDANHAEVSKPGSKTNEIYLGIKSNIEELLKYPISPAILSTMPRSDSAGPIRRGNRMQLRIKTHKTPIVEAADKKPFTVLLCGPPLESHSKNPSTMLCRSIKDHLETDGFDVVLGEDSGIDNPRIKTDINALSNELEFVRSKCNAVVLIADTIGTWCELGMFSWHLAHSKELRERTGFFVLINNSYSEGNDFFRRGPFAFADAFGKAEFADLSRFDASSIVERLKILRSVYTTDNRGRPKVTSK